MQKTQQRLATVEQGEEAVSAGEPGTPCQEQLDNADEQAAQIRRELDGRLQVADQMAKEKIFPRFLTKEMEGMFIEELRASVNLLMANLESLPVSKGGPEFKLQKLKRSTNSGFLDIGDESEVQLSKSDVVLSFTLEIRRTFRFWRLEKTSTVTFFCLRRKSWKGQIRLFRLFATMHAYGRRNAPDPEKGGSGGLTPVF
ncbi:unnamed protein product [Ranitomeya imitator]|uniref:Uncharacterized protein n=1 Tax=Ranitomeya imitator TaxID=111125 RepID=A0ABN9LRK1_9NEOB|nr:unnamed protein product [Ranitomeya imitator]